MPGREAPERDPAGYGQRLGEALFREGVRDQFMAALGDADPQVHVLLSVEADDSIKVGTQERSVRSLRWEWLCAPLDGGWATSLPSPAGVFARPALSR